MSGVVQGHVELVKESGVVSVIATWQRVIEPGEWSGVVAIVVTCQKVRTYRLELGWDI